MVLALNHEKILPENAPVRLTSVQLEELDYRNLYRAYSSRGRKSAVDPRVMFKVMVYGYQCGIYSSRKLEEACRYRVDFMWLLEEENAPDHTTFARFRTGRCASALEDLFYQYVRLLEKQGETDHETVFIDGTKLESAAGRYTFVWRKTVEKQLAKVKEKVQTAVSARSLAELEQYLANTAEGIGFVHGTGRRKSEEQKEWEKLDELRHRSVTADAGYERLGKYLFLESSGQLSFIKPANYEQQKSAKFKKQLGRMENMAYDADEDCYICANGRKLSLRRECTELQNGQYVTTAWYRCEDCKGCPLRENCCQAKDVEQPKELRVNKTLQALRKASQENIATESGIYLRLCRSIQVEGAFGLLKTDFGFRRFLTRGKANVRIELFFLALAFNLKKLWMKRENGRLQTHLSQLSSA